MALYVYIKERQHVTKQVAYFFSYFSLIIGSILLFWAFYPIVSFEIYSRLFINRNVAMPIPHSTVASSLLEANSILGNYNVFSSNVRDFVEADLWFPSQPQQKNQIR